MKRKCMTKSYPKLTFHQVRWSNRGGDWKEMQKAKQDYMYMQNFTSKIQKEYNSW